MALPQRSSSRVRSILQHLQSETALGNLDHIGCSANNEFQFSPSDDLNRERQSGSIDSRQLTFILDGGEEITKIKERIYQQIERDPVLNDGLERYDLTRPEARRICTEKMIRVWEILKQYQSKYGGDQSHQDFARIFIHQMDRFDRSFGMRWFVHWGLFISTIQTHGTEDQQRKWLNDAEELKITGCFAMTELGHSSFLRGLETTATYDSKKDEIVIVSPNVTSTKVWIGIAGQMATHCIVFARLIVGGQDKGVQLFMVPLRDPDTGKPLPGISVGDLGPKMGRNGLDNGWIQFSGVRVPRTNMLMKWAQLSREGALIPSPKAALAYGSLITERVMAVISTTDLVDQALTIATRYGSIRRQGEGDPQILGFQGFQQNLFPHIAASYASHFAFKRIYAVYEAMRVDMKEGNADALLRILPDLHNTSAAMKAFITWWGADALEAARRCLGGHAYSSYSAIPSLIGDFAVLTTGGGDNIVLAQQTARYLMKTYQHALANPDAKRDGLSIAYLYAQKQIIAGGGLKAASVEDLNNLDAFLQAFQYAAIKIIGQTANQIQEAIQKRGKTPNEAWNDSMSDLVECSRAHINVYILESFIKGIKSIEDKPIQAVLNKLAVIYAIRCAQVQTSHLVELECVTSAQLPILRKALVQLCKEIRSEVVGLTDAFGYPDFMLNSPLGRKDGNIYEPYLKAFQNSRGSLKVAPYWNDLVKPFTSTDRSISPY